MSTHTQSSGADASGKNYMAWVEAALRAASTTSPEKMVAELREAGAPAADAEAITAGISVFREKRRARATASGTMSGLGAHRIWQPGRVGEPQRSPRSSFRVRHPAVVTLSALGLAAAAFLYYRGGLPQKEAPVEQRQATATESAMPRDGQQTSSSHLSPGHHREHESEMRPRARLRRKDAAQGQSSPTSPVTSTADSTALMVPPQQTTRLSDCPPGVDRLGCTVLPTGGSAQPTVPANAHAEPNGYGWQCNIGYVQRGRECGKIAVPAHAHLDISGHGWFCDAGFEQNGDTCSQY